MGNPLLALVIDNYRDLRCYYLQGRTMFYQTYPFFFLKILFDSRPLRPRSKTKRRRVGSQIARPQNLISPLKQCDIEGERPPPLWWFKEGVNLVQ